MPESPLDWGAIKVEKSSQTNDSPESWGAIRISKPEGTKTTNAGSDDEEDKQLAANMASYDEEKKQRDAAKKPTMWERLIETGAVLGETPEVGGGPSEIKVPRPTAEEVASATGMSIDHAANLAGFMNSVSSPLIEFPFTPEGGALTAASAIPGVGQVVGAGFTLKAFLDNPQMAREAGVGWVEAHNPQSTPEQKQLGWEKFWGAIGNIGVGGAGAIPSSHTISKKLGATPSPTAALINSAKPILPNAAKEAESIPPEKGQPNAQTIRSDQTKVGEGGVQSESGQEPRGTDLQRGPSGTSDATAQAEVKLTPEEQAKVRSELDEALGQEPSSQPPPQPKPETPVTVPETPPQKTAAEPPKTPETLPETTTPISAGKEGETKTAQAAAAKVEDHLQDVANTQGKRPAKELKSELIQRLEDAVKKAPTEAGFSHNRPGETPSKVTIDIPGDGVFTIFNTKKALTGILKRAKAIEVAPAGKAPVKTRGIPKAITEETKAEIAGQQKSSGISEGPGAASPGDVPSVQLDQLAQTFKSMETKRTWRDTLGEAYDLGKVASAAKDTISRAVSGLKATGDMARNLWENLNDLDDFKRILGKLSRDVETRSYTLRQFAKEVARTMPKVEDQEAIASWVDTGGDEATLRRGMTDTTDRYRKSYQDALNLKPEQLVVAKNIQNYFESRLKEAIDAGILEGGIEDYIHRIYEPGPIKDKVLNAIQSGILDTRSPSLARKRLFEFDFEAEKAGLPIVKPFLPRVLDYEASLSKAIASRAAVKRMTALKMQDGNPMIAIAGLGRVVEDQAGVKPASVIVNPHVLTEKQKGLYVHRDYPALQKWKWVAKDANGKDVFVSGDVLIHKDAVRRIDALLKPSAIRQSKFGRGTLAISSGVKQTMLDLSGFHQVQLTVHALEHRVLPTRIVDKIDLNNPDVQKLLEGGVTLGGQFKWSNYGEGLWGKSLTRLVPGLGKLSESYHEYLFNDYIPRLKMTMAMDALERNRAKYGKTLSEEKLAYLTANEANAAFGELNYTMMERSKTWQDASRLILLAPDFLEARGRFVGQALTKFGSEQRMALLLGAAILYVTARIFNKMIDGQYHFERENLFSIVYKNHAYSLRTVQGDVLHLIDKPVSFWLNRLNPVYGRTALEFATGRDQFGRKRDAMDQAKDFVSTAMPIALRHNREQSIYDSLLVSLGVTARKYSDVGNAYKLANDWRKKAGVKERPEVIYDPDKDDLYGLKVDLWNDDLNGAVKEIKRLIDTGKSTPKKMADHFKAYATSPFTGSRANDKKFIQTLNEDEKTTVQSAITHKRIVWKQFHNALGIYLQAKAAGPPKETP